MSGRGAPLGDKILDEVRSLMALFLKDIRQRKVELALQRPTKGFPLGFSVKTAALPVQDPLPKTVNLLQAWIPIIRMGPLLPKELPLQDVACHWEPALCHEATFSAETLPWHRVTFEKIRQTRISGGPVDPVAKTVASHPVSVPHPAKMKAHRLQIPDTPMLRTRTQPLKAQRLRAPTVPQRLYALPFTKTSIPLHRFSGEAKSQFRKALAEKANTSPTNIQINRIYDRVHLDMYESMSQDSKGQLVCFPKLASIPQRTLAPPQCFYLVFGQRLDTQESLRALVPALGGGTADGH